MKKMKMTHNKILTMKLRLRLNKRMKLTLKKFLTVKLRMKLEMKLMKKLNV